MRAIVNAAFMGAFILVGLVVLPLIIWVAAGPDLTPFNTCWPAGETPQQDVTLIGRCAR